MGVRLHQRETGHPPLGAGQRMGLPVRCQSFAWSASCTADNSAPPASPIRAPAKKALLFSFAWLAWLMPTATLPCVAPPVTGSSHPALVLFRNSGGNDDQS